MRRVSEGHRRIMAMGGIRKRVVVKRDIKRIIIYSAIKIRAKFPALYSTLKPETSSDSPSAKSNGVRFVSAKVEINHMRARGGIRRHFGVIDREIIIDRSK